MLIDDLSEGPTVTAGKRLRGGETAICGNHRSDNRTVTRRPIEWPSTFLPQHVIMIFLINNSAENVPGKAERFDLASPT